jgi:1-acyl-sn-glycerol-3-phosphate acyltransferase
MDGFAIHDQGHGFDLFGMSSRTLGRVLPMNRWFHDRYFRTQSHGIENIPASGGAIMVSNHSGALPVDALMLFTDVVLNTHPPRVPRPVMDLFVPRLPFVGQLFVRGGGVNGTRRNVRRLLDDGELLLIFPEGSKGVAKTFPDRYKLQDWRVGHAELAIRHRVPVIPVAVIGAEEMWPLVARIERFHLFGAPYLPVPAVLFPLPVQLHIWYGPAIDLPALFPAKAANDPSAVDAAAHRVREAVEGLIAAGLAGREGVFR